MEPEDLVRMLNQAAIGRTFEDSGFPDTPDNRWAWAECQKDIVKIRQLGGIVSIPSEPPSGPRNR